MSKQLDEQKIVGASYIFSFYQAVHSLNDQYALYLCNLVEIKGQKLEVMDESTKNQIKASVQELRFILNKVYIQYLTLLQPLNIKENKDITELYEKINDDFMIESEDLKKIVMELNRVLLMDIVKQILESTQDIISNLYSNAADNPPR